MDSELLHKLHRRRTVVDTEGLSWKSTPVPSTADAQGEWLFIDAETEDWELLDSEDGAVVSDDNQLPSLEFLQNLITRLRRTSREEGHEFLKTLSASTRRELQLKLCSPGVPVPPPMSPRTPSDSPAKRNSDPIASVAMYAGSFGAVGAWKPAFSPSAPSKDDRRVDCAIVCSLVDSPATKAQEDISKLYRLPSKSIGGGASVAEATDRAGLDGSATEVGRSISSAVALSESEPPRAADVHLSKEFCHRVAEAPTNSVDLAAITAGVTDSASSVARSRGELVAAEKDDADLEENKRLERERVERERAARAVLCAKRWPSWLVPESAGVLTDATIEKIRRVDCEESGEQASDVGEGRAAKGKVLCDDEMSALRADVRRTRASDPSFQSPEMHSRIEVLLTRFCIQERVHYMQGLHEVVAPFAFVQAMAPKESRFDDDIALACITSFTRRFTPYFHDGDAFVALHISLLFFRQLVLYHHPDVHNLLAEAGISPFLYAMPWFLTLFAAKTPMSVLLRLWDQYLARNNPSFLPFLAVATLAADKAALFASQKDDLQSAAQRTGIKTAERLDAVWPAGEALQARTPKSLSLRLSRLLSAVRERVGTSASTGQAWSERVLERVEKERRFVILAEEVSLQLAREVAAASVAENAPAQTQQRLHVLLLDVRSPEEYAEEHLPQALHFYPPCLMRLVAAFRQDGRFQLDRLAGALSSAVGSYLGSFASPKSSSGVGRSPWVEQSLVSEVFGSLNDAASQRWGEGWLSESAGCHLVLIGGSSDAADLAGQDKLSSFGGAVAPLYDTLTEHVALARVSVALGGAAAVHREAVKRGIHLVSSPPQEAVRVAESPTLVSNPGRESLLTSAWSKLQAASEVLPNTDSVAAGVGSRIGGLMKSSRDAARTLAEEATRRAEAVRQQAPELAAAARRASEGLSASLNYEKGENESSSDQSSTWDCKAWVFGVTDVEAFQAEGDGCNEKSQLMRLEQSTLCLRAMGEHCVLEVAASDVSSGARSLSCAFDVVDLKRVGSAFGRADAMTFYFSSRLTDACENAQVAESAPVEQNRFDPTMRSLVALFPSTHEARCCARTVATFASAARKQSGDTQSTSDAASVRAKIISDAKDASCGMGYSLHCRAKDAATAVVSTDSHDDIVHFLREIEVLICT
eukprot:TRINITY_DN25653_c0_g1_i1.p1 TRINITY_DN25653_c0_g1~~TRINITY_DN25653_c0_g1_i1.p1  ORF type:complete len:1156 (-),score=215.73 TRINITY_DN25653_c0_g1_i1:152-3619(-)